jgi:hypothetical protein
VAWHLVVSRVVLSPIELVSLLFLCPDFDLLSGDETATCT